MTFLRERLDEDEMMAMAAGDRAWRLDVMPGGYPQRVSEDGTMILVCETYDGPTDNTGLKRSPSSGQHIARHDPARVLADVAAKRVLIDVAASVGEVIDGEWGCCHSAADILRGHREPDYDGDAPERLPTSCDGPKELRRILGPLAAVYAEHPDYDEAWAPRRWTP